MASFLPYPKLPAIDLGPVDLQPFGILVATGVLFGAWIGRKRAAYLGVDEDEIRTLTGYLLVFGFLGAHLFDTLFYEWHELADDPLRLIRIWDGISSYGGFIGAFAGWALFVHRHRSARPMVFADITIWGTLPGFTFGRLGCTVVFDHPGAPTDLWTGMAYPYNALWREAGIAPGTVLHNLGFYEFVFLMVLIGLVWLITWAGRKQPVGFVVGFTALLYGPVRFLLDFLRYETTDPRYFELTFGQYMSLATAVAGAVVLYKIYREPGLAVAKVQERQANLDAKTAGAPAAPAAKKPEPAKPPAKKKGTGSKKKRKKK